MDQDRTYWNPPVESILNTAQVKEIQLSKLKGLMARLYAAKPFWRERMDRAGVRPEKIRSLEDFTKSMPIMDKAQRRQLVADCDGDVMEMVDRTIAVPADQVVLMAATSGTSGEPTPYPLTKKDLEVYSELFARMAWRIGIRPRTRIVHAFGLSMWLAGVPYVRFFEGFGALVLPVGAEGGSERILRFANQFKADALFGTPSLMEHLIERSQQVLGKPVGELGINTVVCAGEPGAGIPEVRERLETAYRARVFDHGGGVGISCGHPDYQGMHHVADDKVLLELVDPDTLEPVPFEHGARGLAVQTTLECEGMLWVRETFGDIFEVLTDPCPCGLSGFRYKLIGRADDMLKVKGVVVYPAAIDGVIASFVPRVTGEFRIVLDAPPPRVVPPLTLKVEYGEGLEESELDGLAQEICEALHTRLRIHPRIDWVAPYSLERTVGKTNVFERTYQAGL